MQPSPELSVIIPAYNEEQEIQASLTTIEAKLRGLGVSYEIIAVNDGSNDQTLAKMTALQGPSVVVLSYASNRGKGFAVKEGMLRARGRYRLFMDVDLSTSLDAIGEFLELMRGGDWDVLIGERKSRLLQQKVRQPWIRQFLGGGFIRLSCFCVGRRFRDFTCGFKMFEHTAAETIFTRQRVFDWSFDTELLAIAVEHKLRIAEVPVDWSHHSGSTVHTFKAVFTSLAGLLKIKTNSLKCLYR